ncbi:VanW family protein [Natranaerofaba carboxydovora]|uniref:VanW family protein n=1 Tax=Natranaerofaba carboxydovora TaxID=2742683 RepID=UPI001F1353CD|nr:VanW family protein [Natranaerofaba carboxydovora]UMZ73418.1 Vancomycin B-type resistance protein VanW [Natranaerofaba carboxydovora]
MKIRFISVLLSKKKLLLLLVFILIVGLMVKLDGIEKIQRSIYGVERGVYLYDIELAGLFEEEVEELVRELAKEVDKPYRDAYIDDETGEITDETIGEKVLIGKTVENIMNASKNTEVKLETMPLYPRLSSNILESIEHEISGYSTGIGPGGGAGRVTNIEVATNDVNNTVIWPGEVFSFNGETLPRTWEEGYRFAPIIVGDSVVNGIGGGVCQVSSTLYNVVLEAGLEVVERYPHGEPVDYVPPGRDATVAGDYLDLKFRNNTENFLLIKGEASGGVVSFTLLADDEELSSLN